MSSQPSAIDFNALLSHLEECAKSDQENKDVLSLQLLYGDLCRVHHKSATAVSGHAQTVCPNCSEELMSEFDQLVVHSAVELPSFAGGFHEIGLALRSQFSCCSTDSITKPTLDVLQQFWVAMCTHFVLYMEEISSIDDHGVILGGARSSDENGDGEESTINAAKLLPREEASLRRCYYIERSMDDSLGSPWVPFRCRVPAVVVHILRTCGWVRTARAAPNGEAAPGDYVYARSRQLLPCKVGDVADNGDSSLVRGVDYFVGVDSLLRFINNSLLRDHSWVEGEVTPVTSVARMRAAYAACAQIEGHGVEKPTGSVRAAGVARNADPVRTRDQGAPPTNTESTDTTPKPAFAVKTEASVKAATEVHTVPKPSTDVVSWQHCVGGHKLELHSDRITFFCPTCTAKRANGEVLTEMVVPQPVRKLTRKKDRSDSEEELDLSSAAGADDDSPASAAGREPAEVDNAQSAERFLAGQQPMDIDAASSSSISASTSCIGGVHPATSAKLPKRPVVRTAASDTTGNIPPRSFSVGPPVVAHKLVKTSSLTSSHSRSDAGAGVSTNANANANASTSSAVHVSASANVGASSSSSSGSSSSKVITSSSASEVAKASAGMASVPTAGIGRIQKKQRRGDLASCFITPSSDETQNSPREVTAASDPATRAVKPAIATQRSICKFVNEPGGCKDIVNCKFMHPIRRPVAPALVATSRNSDSPVFVSESRQGDKRYAAPMASVQVAQSEENSSGKKCKQQLYGDGCRDSTCKLYHRTAAEMARIRKTKCSFFSKCVRPNCVFMHPKDHVYVGSVDKKSMCPHSLTCMIPNCPAKHPFTLGERWNLCKSGNFCANGRCKYLHRGQNARPDGMCEYELRAPGCLVIGCTLSHRPPAFFKNIASTRCGKCSGPRGEPGCPFMHASENSVQTFSAGMCGSHYGPGSCGTSAAAVPLSAPAAASPTLKSPSRAERHPPVVEVEPMAVCQEVEMAEVPEVPTPRELVHPLPIPASASTAVHSPALEPVPPPPPADISSFPPVARMQSAPAAVGGSNQTHQGIKKLLTNLKLLQEKRNASHPQ